MPLATLGSAAGLVAGIFTGTISVGTALVALMVLSIAGFFASRYKLTEIAQDQTTAANEQTKIANEATREWRENYITERARADDFEKRYQEQRALKHELQTQLDTARLKTDNTLVLKAIESQMRALRSFHDDFLARDVSIRAAITESEERMVGQLADIARVLERRT